MYGGRLLTGWEKDGDGFYAADVPGVGDGSWDFRVLLVNGRFAPRARFPKEGALTHLDRFDALPELSPDGLFGHDPRTKERISKLHYKEGDLGSWLDVNNAEVVVVHQWDESLMRLTAHDPETQTLTFLGEAAYPPGAFGMWQSEANTYFVWNVREGMQEPGQWYLDRTREKVVYWPRPGEDMSAAQVIVPTTVRVIHVKGEKETPVTGVTIKGLTISVTTGTLPPGRRRMWGADLPAAVETDSSKDCQFFDLTVAKVGDHAFRLTRSDGMTVAGCEVTRIGGGGIYHGGGADARLTRNRIHNIGLIHRGSNGIGVMAWVGENNVVSHNEIFDAPYVGIGGYGKRFHITHNHIRDVMKALHDGAGIYISYADVCTITDNFIHNVHQKMGHGIYFDKPTTDCVAERNVVIDTERPLLLSYATRGTVRDNVFIDDGPAEILFREPVECTFARNRVSARGVITFGQPGSVIPMPDNVFYSATNEYENVPAQALKDGSVFVGIRLDAWPESVGPMMPQATIDPVLLEEEHLREATTTLHLTNRDTETPMSLKAHLGGAGQLQFHPDRIQELLAPGTTKAIPIRLTSAEPVPLDALQSLVVSWSAAFRDPALGPVEREHSGVPLPVDRVFECRRTQAPITVDGNLDDWPDLPFTYKPSSWDEDARAIWSGVPDSTYAFGVACDDGFVYVAVQARDDDYVYKGPGSPHFAQDSVAVVLDARSSADRDVTAWKQEQIDFLNLSMYPGTTRDEMFVYMADELPEGTQAICVRTETGYAAEVAVPAAYLTDKQGAPWSSFRLNVLINDHDSSDYADGAVLRWRPDWTSQEDYTGAGTFLRPRK